MKIHQHANFGSKVFSNTGNLNCIQTMTLKIALRHVHNTLAYHDASSDQICLQMVQQVWRYGERKSILPRILTFSDLDILDNSPIMTLQLIMVNHHSKCLCKWFNDFSPDKPGHTDKALTYQPPPPISLRKWGGGGVVFKKTAAIRKQCDSLDQGRKRGEWHY